MFTCEAFKGGLHCHRDQSPPANFALASICDCARVSRCTCTEGCSGRCRNPWQSWKRPRGRCCEGDRGRECHCVLSHQSELRSSLLMRRTFARLAFCPLGQWHSDVTRLPVITVRQGFSIGIDPNYVATIQTCRNKVKECRFRRAARRKWLIFFHS